jgi:hypothetical protein
MDVEDTKTAKLSGVDWLQFFSGGVPALDYFLMQVDHLRELVDKSTVETGINVTAELCMIGLAAYFEAFCKNEFAAVINIVPEILNRFADKRECRITAKSLLHVLLELDHSLGFLISEEFDFGSAKAVNGLCQNLLNVTPFSKKETTKYAEFLNDRNLLVHHGGIYTAKYKGQKFVKKHARAEIYAGVYFDSLVIRKVDVHKWADFLTRVAKKMGDATGAALLKFVASEGFSCDPERTKAIEGLGNLRLAGN